MHPYSFSLTMSVLLQILSGIQELLDTPNQDDPAQEPAYHALRQDPKEYSRQVRVQVHPPHIELYIRAQSDWCQVLGTGIMGPSLVAAEASLIQQLWCLEGYRFVQSVLQQSGYTLFESLKFCKTRY